MPIVITSWTTALWQGGAYTLDWNDMGGRLLTPYCVAISAAAAERAAAVGVTVPAAVNNCGQNRVPTVDWAHALQTVIESCIPRFVNHTGAATWDGSATCAPYWTTATIEAHTGATVGPHPEKGEIPHSAAWVRNCKLILDHLRWTRRTHVLAEAGGGWTPDTDDYDLGITTSLTGHDGDTAARDASFGTLAAAVDDAVSRISGSPYTNYIGSETYADTDDDSSDWWATAAHCWGKIRAEGIYDDIQHAAQYYLWTEPAGTYGETSRTMDDEGRGYTASAWNYIEELAAAAIADQTSNEFGTPGGGWPPVYPPNGGNNSVNWRGWVAYLVRIIHRWDCAGGFVLCDAE